MTSLKSFRSFLRTNHLSDDRTVLNNLIEKAEICENTRLDIQSLATGLVKEIRANGNTGLMEVFLAEYGLSTDEGVALMCLAEALLRVPDTATIDELIDDKITPSAWNEHLGKSSSSLVNASTWALMLTGKVLQDGQGVAASLRGAVKRLGEPVIRAAVGQAMREMGRQFVLGQTIKDAIKRGQQQQRKGFTYSYDMLGEAALTAADAARNYDEYAASIRALTPHCTAADIRDNPGISIKLSAIHPRYEYTQGVRVLTELVPRVLQLAQLAADAGMGLNIDAEEAERLDLSLDVIQAVLTDPSLAGWDGFGVVVQAYGKRAEPVIDWLHSLAEMLDRRIMVRLVKGAYWDTEIKRAQIEGLNGFPVFSHKEATDISYICCAKKLLGMSDRIYPQFATHNAHTVAAVQVLAGGTGDYEFQRLHGMGEALHDIVKQTQSSRCRIYAPVGTHRDLLAYLVRRLLENGANSSFVNQIASKTVSAKEICADPFEGINTVVKNANGVVHPKLIFGDLRENSMGWDLLDHPTVVALDAARDRFISHKWTGKPLLVAKPQGTETSQVMNPANPDDCVGVLTLASAKDAETAVGNAQPWGIPAKDRADILRHASDLFEQNHGELFAILCREAGKTLDDAIAELREAVDFLRYYAGEAERLSGSNPRGIITCISPWNFPLAIFTGQIAAALAAGNAVLAKPAEPTGIIATLASQLMHQAGVPRGALQLLPGHGSVVGHALTSMARINGTCFTGSTATAQKINRAMAECLTPDAPLIAETGGINAMIVDSTALPEQAVADIVMSAFKSAGQRCSALRMLYIQNDVADDFLAMLYGAMEELGIGDPWHLATDIGPIINDAARADINSPIQAARDQGRLLKQLSVPQSGSYVGPAVIAVDGIGDIGAEIFGPVLHVARYEAHALDKIVDDINASGFGLTFGMHSRIDDRIAQVTSRLRAGNIYINRNQIGAVVASQPFGGEGLSGTGPKAGGPNYVERFTGAKVLHPIAKTGKPAEMNQVRAEIARAVWSNKSLSRQAMPGPTGESNQLSVYGRGVILCLGTSHSDAQQQARIVRANGCAPVVVAPGATGEGSVDGFLARGALADLAGIAGVVLWSDADDQRAARLALAAREGAILPLITERHFGVRCVVERHICIDTTAAGGNASLLAAAS